MCVTGKAVLYGPRGATLGYGHPGGRCRPGPSLVSPQQVSPRPSPTWEMRLQRCTAHVQSWRGLRPGRTPEHTAAHCWLPGQVPDGNRARGSERAQPSSHALTRARRSAHTCAHTCAHAPLVGHRAGIHTSRHPVYPHHRLQCLQYSGWKLLEYQQNENSIADELSFKSRAPLTWRASPQALPHATWDASCPRRLLVRTPNGRGSSFSRTRQSKSCLGSTRQQEAMCSAPCNCVTESWAGCPPFRGRDL